MTKEDFIKVVNFHHSENKQLNTVGFIRLVTKLTLGSVNDLVKPNWGIEDLGTFVYSGLSASQKMIIQKTKFENIITFTKT